MNYEFNRKIFADAVREDKRVFNGKISSSQWEGMEALLDYIDLLKWHPTSKENQYFYTWNAYNFATAKWETAHTMQPITELGSRAYLTSKRYYPYIGRGFVQMTWANNYKRSDREIANNNLISKRTLDMLPGKVVNQHKHMDQALNLEIASCNLMVGNWKGWWTGKKLSTYLTNSKTDYINARRIVNGTDRAQKIATIAKGFEEAFRESWVKKEEEPVIEVPNEGTPTTTEFINELATFINDWRDKHNV